jgi:2-polyprenyl-6-methoxyphenol hydroxylase-like FAD-dependent oxidoreductase
MAIVGAGYGGMVTTVVLAEQGRVIVLVEQDPARLTALADGRSRSVSRAFPRRARPSTPAGGSCRARRSPGTGWTSS